MELTVGDWQRPGMLGDLQNVGILLTGQLPNRNILPSPKLPVRAHVSVGWEGRESHPRLALNSEFVKVLVVVIQSCLTFCNTMDRNPPGLALLTFWVR